VSLHGLGEGTDLTFAVLEQWLQGVVNDTANAGFKTCTIVLPSHPLTRGRVSAQAILRTIALCAYRFHDYHSSAEPAALTSVRLQTPPSSLARKGAQQRRSLQARPWRATSAIPLPTEQHRRGSLRARVLWLDATT
jgi:hypothetical protein